MKRWVALVLSSAILVLGATSARAEKDRYEVGETVPMFSIKAINADVLGENFIAIDRYIGTGAKDPKKALLLSFFATYCEPCKKEMPLLAALFDAYQSKGLQIVLVSIDTERDKVEVAKNLARDAGVKFPVLADSFNLVARRYYVTKLPNSYLVGADGKVLAANVGYSGDVSKSLVDDIRKALSESTSEPIPEAISMHMGSAGTTAEVVAAAVEGGEVGNQDRGDCASCAALCTEQSPDCQRAGNPTACFQQTACLCQCLLKKGGCGLEPNVLSSCVATNLTVAAHLASGQPTPSAGPSASPSSPPSPSP